MILVLQNLTPDGPAYLGHWLTRGGHDFRVFDTQRGDAYPDRIEGYSALAVLGGEMSANDDLASLRQAERLILQAFDAGVPVLGHCLGGQLMARALGARVGRSPRPEIGWRPLRVAESPEALAWFGRGGEHTVYHWHEEAFDLPRGAVPLATSDDCPYQAFTLGDGRHLAMQFHVELDAAKLAVWAASTDPAFLRLQQLHGSVQSGAVMRKDAARFLPAQQALADRIYTRWLRFSQTD